MPTGLEEEPDAAAVETRSASEFAGMVKLWAPAGATHVNPPYALLV